MFKKYKKEQQEAKKDNKKRCPYCNCILKYRGPKNSYGVIYWKCRNKKCGRTVNFRTIPKEVRPLTFIDKVKRVKG